MGRNILLVAGMLFCLSVRSVAQEQEGDTLVVQTFTFDDITRRRDFFDFPDNNETYAKIQMIRTIKCDEKTRLDKYPCGEWDYSTHTHLYIPLNESVQEVFELENFVTPYGKRLDLGEDGFTFVYDVTDYAPILKGKVELSSGNTAELVDLKFLFIKGIPVRNVISVENIYPWGSYKYQDLADEKALKPVNLYFNPDAKGFMLRSRISGHGHHGPRNCCEWDSKTHSYFGNDEVLFRWNVWKNCGNNPIYPQGGTWQFDRAGWCPGTPVDTYDFELTRFVNPGDSLEFDYGIEMYKDNGEKDGYYIQSHQLFSYEGPNFKNDAAIADIIAPSSKDEYSRVNPICKDPKIMIQNTGSNTLRSLVIKYGLKNANQYEYKWSGQLEFLDKEEITLPNIPWDEAESDPRFIVSIQNTNGGIDENTRNNTLISKVKLPLLMAPSFFLVIDANDKGRAHETSYTITNASGELFYERESLEDEQEYEEYIEQLPAGCYELRIKDKNEDGMIRHWWYRSSKPELIGRNGRIAIYNTDRELIEELKYDFAETEIFRFRIEE